MSKIHVLQHIQYEQPATIETYLRQKGHSFSFTRFYNNESIPTLSEFDWLIIMGGYMSVHDEADFPWLSEEKRFIKESIEAGKTVLGICLGAQLIAASLGARVYKNTHSEIGWFPIYKQNSAERSAVGRVLPAKIDMFHWHGDTFDLPEDAVLLASSDVCHNQAFSIDDRVIGLQFHPEVNEETARLYISHSPDKLNQPPYIQSAEQILENPVRFSTINRVMINILDTMAK